MVARIFSLVCSHTTPLRSRLLSTRVIPFESAHATLAANDDENTPTPPYRRGGFGAMVVSKILSSSEPRHLDRDQILSRA